MKIVVNEKLIIFEPTQQVKDWCRDNLVIDNPEYYRLERMGKWTGNTPQTIKLYEYHNTYTDQILLLPFGCILDIWKMHPIIDDWTIGIKPIDKINYHSKINLYGYQEQAVQMVLKKTNSMIILLESVKLMEQGILGGTGETIVYEDGNGNKKQVEMPEPIHTYQKWKELGYQVRRGEKAIAKFPIWKYVEKKQDKEETKGKGKMFLKTSAFFKSSQVDKKEEAK